MTEKIYTELTKLQDQYLRDEDDFIRECCKNAELKDRIKFEEDFKRDGGTRERMKSF